MTGGKVDVKPTGIALSPVIEGVLVVMVSLNTLQGAAKAAAEDVARADAERKEAAANATIDIQNLIYMILKYLHIIGFA